ncbi:DUF6359 domain-containing protein [Prevotella fusca]
MKFDKLFFMLLAMLCLSGCSKTVLPSDDDQGEETGKHVPSASPDGEQKVYSVEEFLNGEFGNRYVWVHGYIVGACKRSIKQAEWEPPFSYDSAVLLADSPGESDPEQVISVQMVGKQMKEEIALASNPQNYGREIAFYGLKQKYLGIPGMKKHILASEWLDE